MIDGKPGKRSPGRIPSGHSLNPLYLEGGREGGREGREEGREGKKGGREGEE